jgi:glutamine cyclotransferase
MKKLNLLYIILLGIILINCGDTKKGENSIFSIDNSAFKPFYTSKDILKIGILNPSSKTIDSIIYYINDIKVSTSKGNTGLDFPFKDQKLGYQNIKALVYFGGDISEATGRVELVSDIEPKLLKYTVVNTYPHDVKSFTEGLEFYKDTLYESTGQEGASYIRKYDYKTGKTYKQINLDTIYFGEGITFINDKLFQLTYKNKKGFIYNATTLKLEKTFNYEKDIEGWGMTNDGEYIYQTDGTEKIWKVDPTTQKMIDYINVYSGSSKVKAINELELINGKIYTNVWFKDAIAVVNPKNGAVEGILNLSDLRKSMNDITKDDVLNGIAYNERNKTIFVTGKNWSKMFEIKVSE